MKCVTTDAEMCTVSTRGSKRSRKHGEILGRETRTEKTLRGRQKSLDVMQQAKGRRP